MRLLVTVLSTALLASCSIGENLAFKSTSKILQRAQPGLQMESDYELARMAIPGALKTVEGFWVAGPPSDARERLERILTEGYCQYGTGFVSPAVDTMYVLAGHVGVLDPKLTEVYFWPITNDYRADFTTLNDAQMISELTRTEATLVELTGRTSKPFWRPPFGARNVHVLDVIEAQGYIDIFWTLDSGDWVANAPAQQVLNTVTQRTRPGSIVVMHLGSPQTAAVLGLVLKGLFFHPWLTIGVLLDVFVLVAAATAWPVTLG